MCQHVLTLLLSAKFSWKILQTYLWGTQASLWLISEVWCWFWLKRIACFFTIIPIIAVLIEYWETQTKSTFSLTFFNPNPFHKSLKDRYIQKPSSNEMNISVSFSIYDKEIYLFDIVLSFTSGYPCINLNYQKGKPVFLILKVRIFAVSIQRFCHNHHVDTYLYIK